MKKSLNGVLGVYGSIAAYRAPDFARFLIKNHCNLRVSLTKSAEKFSPQLVYESLLNQKIYTNNSFSPDLHGTEHIEWGRWADFMLLYGLTAHALAVLAHGFAHNFLNLQVLAFDGPVFIAPAMNVRMWENSVVQENLKKLLSRKNMFMIDPIESKLACGDFGIGHIAQDSEILSQVYQHFDFSNNEILEANKNWVGKKLLISAGSMETDLDYVRALKNKSSGKTALELAKILRSRGAEITLLLGPNEQSKIEWESVSSDIHYYRSFEDYFQQVKSLFPKTDCFFSASAVLDFSLERQEKKIEKKVLASGTLNLKLSLNEDVLEWCSSQKRTGQKIISFSLELENSQKCLERAQEKSKNKGADYTIINFIHKGDVFKDEAEYVLYRRKKEELLRFDQEKKSLALRKVINSLELGLFETGQKGVS